MVLGPWMYNMLYSTMTHQIELEIQTVYEHSPLQSNESNLLNSLSLIIKRCFCNLMKSKVNTIMTVDQELHKFICSQNMFLSLYFSLAWRSLFLCKWPWLKLLWKKKICIILSRFTCRWNAVLYAHKNQKQQLNWMSWKFQKYKVSFIISHLEQTSNAMLMYVRAWKRKSHKQFD